MVFTTNPPNEPRTAEPRKRPNPTKQAEPVKRPKLALPKLISKIYKTKDLVTIQNGLKEHQRTNIGKAFAALNERDPDETESKSVKYKKYLKHLHATGGSPLVMVCVMGLGKKCIGDLGTADRLSILQELDQHRDKWDTPAIRTLAEGCWTAGHFTAS
jgi:hypothetical protein